MREFAFYETRRYRTDSILVQVRMLAVQSPLQIIESHIFLSPLSHSTFFAKTPDIYRPDTMFLQRLE
jgi:hypothetical protein